MRAAVAIYGSGSGRQLFILHLFTLYLFTLHLFTLYAAPVHAAPVHTAPAVRELREVNAPTQPPLLHF